MTTKKTNLKMLGLKAIGWVNLLPVIYLGWCAAVGLVVSEMQWVGALVTGVIGLLMLLILYSPTEER